MKNKKITMIRMALLCLLCVSVVLLLFYDIPAGSENSVGYSDGLSSGYHIQIVTEKDRDYFWDDFKTGAERAAEEKKVFVEFVESETRTTEDIVSLIKRGVYAGVDGIAFRPTDIEKCSEAVKMAKENGTSIITFESEENVLPMVGSVNSNYHQVGLEQGKLLLEVTGGVGNVAVIMNEKDMQEGEAICNAEKMRGIAECLPSDGRLQILDYYKVDIELYQTEKILKQVFLDYPEVDSLVCTDASITQSASDYLKREGLDGKIRLIGYGNRLETLEDIKNGVVYGTVYPDTEEMGYQVVKKLCDILDGTGKEDILSMEVKVIKGEMP